MPSATTTTSTSDVRAPTRRTAPVNASPSMASATQEGYARLKAEVGRLEQENARLTEHTHRAEVALARSKKYWEEMYELFNSVSASNDELMAENACLTDESKQLEVKLQEAEMEIRQLKMQMTPACGWIDDRRCVAPGTVDDSGSLASGTVVSEDDDSSLSDEDEKCGSVLC